MTGDFFPLSSSFFLSIDCDDVIFLYRCHVNAFHCLHANYRWGSFLIISYAVEARFLNRFESNREKYQSFESLNDLDSLLKKIIPIRCSLTKKIDKSKNIKSFDHFSMAFIDGKL